MSDPESKVAEAESKTSLKTSVSKTKMAEPEISEPESKTSVSKTKMAEPEISEPESKTSVSKTKMAEAEWKIVSTPKSSK